MTAYWTNFGKMWNFIGPPQRLKSDLFEIFLRTYAAPEAEGACEVKKNIKKAAFILAFEVIVQ